VSNSIDPAGPAEHGEALIREDRRLLLRSVSLSVFGQMGAYAAGLLTMVATTRLLGPEGYGRLAIFFMLIEMLSHLLGWPNTGLVRFGREELGRDGRLAETFRARALLFFFSLGGVAAMLFLARGPLGRYLDLSLPPWLLLLCFVGVNELIFLLRGVYQTTGAFGGFAAITFAVRALNLLLILVIFVWIAAPANVSRILLAQTASITLVAGGAAAFLPWRKLLPPKARPGLVRRMVSWSWPIIFVGLSALVVNWIDLVVIKHFRTPEELGWYAASYQAVTVLTALQVAFVNGFMPLIVSLAVERRRDTLRLYLDELVPQAAWLIGGGCLALAACAEAIPVLLGARYAPSVVPCQVLMAGVGFCSLAALQAVLLKAVDRVRATFIVMAVLAALNIMLDVALVPRYGNVGAAVATTVAFALSGLLYFPIVNAVSELRGEAPRRRYRALAGLLLPLVMAGGVLRLGDATTRLLLAAVLLIVWLASARMLGVFKRETLDKARDIRMPGWFERGLRSFYRLVGR
jgi:O-antigen/teichoic acid export membrane protein